MTSADIYKELQVLRTQNATIIELLKSRQDEWVGEKEAAHILSMSVSGVRALRREGRLKHIRIRPTGRGVQYLRSELESLFIQP